MIDDTEYPAQPVRSGINYAGIKSINYKSAYSVGRTPTNLTLKVHFGNVRPKEVGNPQGCFFIGASASCQVKLLGHLYGNNISDPIAVDLSVDIVAKGRDLDLSELDK